MCDLKKEVIDVLETFNFGDTDIGLNQDLSVLGIDSLGKVELILALEQKFVIQFDMSDLNPEKLETVSDILELVKRYVEG